MKFLTLLLILVIIPLVIAIPELPHQFYGTVSDDNGLISSETLTAKLCNIEFTAQIENGNYGLNEPYLITREDCSDLNIEFYIDTHKIKDYSYESSAYTELNFNIPVFSPASNNGGNGGSSDNDHNSGSPDVKSKMYQVIQIDDNVIQDDNQEENQLSDKTIETEQTSSQNLFSNLKDTTIKIVSAPFKTRKTTFFSLLITCLIVFTLWYFIKGRNLQKTI